MLTGAGNKRILQNAAFLMERGAAVQFRMPLVPGINDDPEHLAELARFVRSIGAKELRVLPYHWLYLDKYTALGLWRPCEAPKPPPPRACSGPRRSWAATTSRSCWRAERDYRFPT